MGRRWLRALAIVAVFAVLAYGAISWVFSDKLIGQRFAPPAPVDVTKFGLPQPQVTAIPGEGVTLAAWYFENPRNAGCAVVMLHGFGGNKAQVLAPTAIFWERGCHLLLYDARGHGASSRSLLTYGVHERQDLRLAIDWLTEHAGLPRSRIGLIGWSYGAATAIETASEVHDVAFVIADSSYSSLTDIASVQANKQYGTWVQLFLPGALLVSGLRAGFDVGDAAPARAIRDVRAPVLLIHSRTDGFTPVEHSRLIYANSDQSRTRLVIPDWDAPHAESYVVDPDAYTALVDAFLDDLAPGFGIGRAKADR